LIIRRLDMFGGCTSVLDTNCWWLMLFMGVFFIRKASPPPPRKVAPSKLPTTTALFLRAEEV
jgi:hypothetical protein